MISQRFNGFHVQTLGCCLAFGVDFGGLFNQETPTLHGGALIAVALTQHRVDCASLSLIIHFGFISRQFPSTPDTDAFRCGRTKDPIHSIQNGTKGCGNEKTNMLA